MPNPAPVFALAAVCIGIARQGEGAADPRAVIRRFVASGNYADAAEAISGLPSGVRDHELANLYFHAFCLRASREAAERALESTPGDPELRRIVADLDFTEGKYSSARTAYEALLRDLGADTGGLDESHEEELRFVRSRLEMLAGAETYRRSVREAETRAETAGFVALAVMALTAVGVVVAMVRPPLRGDGGSRSETP